MSHVGEYSSPLRVWELLLAWVQVRARQFSVGPGQNRAPPRSTRHGPASTESDDRTVLGPCSFTQHISRVVSRAQRESVGKPLNYSRRGAGGRLSETPLPGPLLALLPVSAGGLVFLCSLSINILALLF